MSDIQSFVATTSTYNKQFPAYVELHYQSFKHLWQKSSDIESRYSYLSWLVAYDHKSPLLNYAKNDPKIINDLLTPFIDEHGQSWMLTKVEYYFAKHRQADFLAWGFPPIDVAHQERYREWFLWSPHFKHLLPEPKINTSFQLYPYPFHSDGIDILGSPRAHSGVGESTRSLIALAIQLGLKVNIIDLEPQNQNSKQDDTYVHLISHEPKYKIRIFNTTIQNVPTIVFENGINLFAGSYNIMYFAWEFNMRPKQYDDAFLLIDEIWTISDFINAGFENPYNVPVHTQPCSVRNINPTTKNRSQYNLPSLDFLFLCAFDFNSYMSRKNPILAVDAFIKDFSQASDVGLVIKVSNNNPADPAWLELTKKINNHKNIFLIDQVLNRDSFIELLSSIDTFISPHRSEGFGYVIAECMLLKKPVICTGFSGNMDYCTQDNSYLIDYDLVKVRPNEYVASAGFEWAEPKIDSLLKQMHSVLTDEKLRSQKVNKAFHDIQSKYTTAALNDVFKKNIQTACHNSNTNYSHLLGGS